MAERDNGENLEFSWGQKVGVDCKGEYYESFTYDGMEYSIYDTVYMYKEGVPEPYIGKLIGIWETVERIKQVYVHWFFRPYELSRCLGDITPLENEIFLATGKGIGLSNFNNLEAICGKCNVVCTSKDSRNRQPSKKEIEMADHIFYRTFDVRLRTISDKMGDEVGGLKVKYVFNNEESKIAIGLEEVVGKTIGCDGMNKHFLPNSSNKNECMPGKSSDYAAGIDSPVLAVTDEQLQAHASSDEVNMGGIGNMKEGVINNEYGAEENLDSDDVHDRPKKRARLYNSAKLPVDKISNAAHNLVVEGEKSVPFASNWKRKSKSDGKDTLGLEKGVKFSKEIENSKDIPSYQRKKIVSLYATSSLGIKKVDSNVKKTSGLVMDSLGLKSIATKEKDHENTRKHFKDTSCKVPVTLNNGREMKPKDIPTSSEGLKKVDNNVEKTSGLVKDSVGLKSIATKEKDHENTRKHSKNTSCKVPVTLNNGREMKPKDIPTSSEGLKKVDNNVEKTSRLIKDSVGLKSIATKEKDHENVRKHSKNTSCKMPVTLNNGRELEPKDIPRSEIDKGKWYSETNKVLIANEGTVLLLWNLDPRYTSEDVKDIIKDAFGTSCTAIMVLHSKKSNPHSGQALVKFNNSEITDRVFTKLSKGCLMLPNGRPLVCTAAPPLNSTEGQRSYFGHLVLDNIKLQGDSRDAVSTSHCSQPNTIEYEMAMEWCLLQTRFDKGWDTLYKQHDKDIRKLKVNLKLR